MKDHEPHPWSEFLKARVKAIMWMSEHMNRSDYEISYMLSTDEEQITIIRNYYQKNREEIL